MAYSFASTLHTLTPNLLVAGEQMAAFQVKKFVSGAYRGQEYGILTIKDDKNINFSESLISGYVKVDSLSTLFTTLKTAGMVELITDEILVSAHAVSKVETSETQVKIEIEGESRGLTFMKSADGDFTGYLPAAADRTWTVDGTLIETLRTTATALRESIDVDIDNLAASIAAESQARIDADAAEAATRTSGFTAADLDREAIRAAIEARAAERDALIASGMWLFADQASFPDAATNHGRVVHSHADGAIFYAHGGMWHQVATEVDLQTTIDSVANEATARVAADDGLDARLDVLEADPTTAAAVAAGDAATLSSANSYTDTAVSNVIGSAPGVLDTLGEIADAINDDANAYTTLVTQIAAVQTDVDGNETDGDAADAALSGRLDVLEADPTTATAVAAVQADVDQNETDADAADAALSARLDVLEADPTTAAAVAAVQADVDQNETDSDAADAALSGRLDVLEADPTTATAVAAVQADVDQNETDADAADAALSARLDVLEADPTTATAVAAVQSDVDQNEADADAALALKAPLADPDFTGLLEVDTNARLEFDSNLTKLHNVLRGTSIVIGNNITLNPAAADGRVEIEGEFYLRPSDLTNAADDTAAAAAGVIVGQVYRNGSQLMVRVS